MFFNTQGSFMNSMFYGFSYPIILGFVEKVVRLIGIFVYVSVKGDFLYNTYLQKWYDNI